MAELIAAANMVLNGNKGQTASNLRRLARRKNQMVDRNFSLGIVGLGPRGHYALECFLRTLADNRPASDVSIVVFEETDELGTGPVWSVKQSSCNWSNVTERVLDLAARPQFTLGDTDIPEFPSYHVWAGLDFDEWPADRIDTFPPRADVGRYMGERCRTLVDPLIAAGSLKLVVGRVDDVDVADDGVRITTNDGNTYFAGQLLLTIGHQPTTLDDQLGTWLDRAEASPTLTVLPDPYPVEDVLRMVGERSDLKLALRGFGLATIDVVRAIAQQLGTFSERADKSGQLEFNQDDATHVQLVPFSLDGLPLGPKPLTPEIDAVFAPSSDRLAKMRARLRDPSRQSAATDDSFLLDEMVPLVAEVYQSIEYKRCKPDDDVEDIIRSWVADQRFAHPCLSNPNQPARDLMAQLVGMAIGNEPVSLDYCIGQVWRHCHATIYAALSHSQLSNEALAQIIKLDESLKRYSFGPPVKSIQQLIALVDAGVLDLRFVNDPEIARGEDCWILQANSNAFSTTTFVNAVLDSPNIKAVNAPLVTSLMRDGVFKQAHDGLGVLTDETGFVTTTDETFVPVAVLGRLAKGSVIGVDAILECFGERAEHWARAAVGYVNADVQGKVTLPKK